jgi:hypothetical protein
VSRLYLSLSSAELRIAILLFALISAFLFAIHTRDVGFAPDVHDFVSSHTLAIASHAEPSTGFVGYGLRTEDDAGRIEYDYFDRCPVFFSVLMNLILKAAGPSPGGKLYLARQAMNAIFLATLAVAFLIARRLASDSYVAGAAALMTFSGSQLMFFKDMTHFDQPALLGLLVLLFAIFSRDEGGSRRLLYGCALFAVSFGRGYVSLLFVVFWTAIQYAISFRQKWPNPFAAALLCSKSDAARVLALTVALSSLYVIYNVATEARIRHVAWSSTSIVESAAGRMGFAPLRTGRNPSWIHYAAVTTGRVIRLTLPYPAFKDISEHVPAGQMRAALPVAAAAFLLFAVLIAYMSALPPVSRRFCLLLVASGLPWFIGMRRHAGSFNYATIYFAGATLTFYTALFSRVPVRLRSAALVATTTVFIISAVSANVDRSALAASEPYTADFARILPQLRPEYRIYVAGDYRNLVYAHEYALGFFLSRQIIVPPMRADYILSKDPHFTPENLTPDNKAVFLFPAKPGVEQR